MRLGRSLSVLSLLLLAAAGCHTKEPDPLRAALPTLPPTGGPVVTAAGQLTAANFEAERVAGPASQGLVGDYYMRNDKVRLVVQAPGRAIGPCPFGGNVIDFDRVDEPAGDQLGEVSAFLQLGRTFSFDSAEIVRDGSKGGPAVLRFYGHDAKDDFINIPGLGSFAVGISDEFLADVDLHLRAAVTYILMPGETHVRMIYTMYNAGESDVNTLWGTLSDTGAGPEIFHPYLGFGEMQISDVLDSSKLPLVKYAALLGRRVDLAYGIVPIYADPSVSSASLAIAGVDVEVYDIGDLFDAFGRKGWSLNVPVGGTASREVDLVLGRDVADVTAQVHGLRGEATVPFAGTVEGGAGARVMVLDLDAPEKSQFVTTATADSSGRFAGALPPGRYSFTAEGDGFRRGAALTATLPAGDLALSVPPAAWLDYRVTDRDGDPIPAKITVLGEPAAPPDRRFRDSVTDALPHGVANWRHSLGGDSSLATRYDAPIPLAPGRYRVVVTRGPEWSRYEQVIDLTASGARVDAVLDHVAPTPGYLACDFHQHSHLSPDAVAPPADRVVSYLVDGVDFISSSDHDYLFDYRPLIDMLGAGDLLDSAVGEETTTWDYGHYIGFPLTPDPDSPNHGALDWAGGELGLNLTPPQILDGLRALGAQVVQVNHPRSTPDDFSSFQQGFDRVGLRFDFTARTFYGDAALMPVSAELLGLPPDAELFAPTFDTHELYNGFHVTQTPEGERIDNRVDTNLRDWMNFLSFGFTPAPTGVSDSHEWISSPGGLPRTLVRVPDDSQAAIAHGLADEVIRTLLGDGVPKDVIVTNGPFIQFSVDGTGIGGTVAHSSGPLAVHVAVTSPEWAPVDTVEIFANETFTVPTPKGMEPEPLRPALCYTSREPAPARCASAIGGPRPLVATLVEDTPGQTAHWEISVDDTVDPETLLARQRAGARGQDLWLVARTTGDVGLYPMIPTGLDPATPIAELVDDLDLIGRGVPGLAFTNAIFVDGDGGGWRGPFQP